MKKIIFIAGTGKDVGKTSISLALMHLFSKQYRRIGYIKPISQRSVCVGDQKAGDDPVLIKQVFKLKSDLSDMSPVIIEGDFTERVIRGEIKQSFARNILRAFKSIEQESDLVIVEGAGRAGVGSIINQSNADTARLLNADVLLVGGGGIGRAVDNVMLDKSFFEAKGCRVIGVVINKIFPWKYEKVWPLLKEWFQKEKIPLFGILPYHASLSWPDLSLVKKETRSAVVCSEEFFDRKIERVLIAAKGIDGVLEDIRKAEKGVLLIVPADRSDLFFFLISSYFKNMACSGNVMGVLISGASDDLARVEEIFKSFWVPVLVSPYSVYDLAVKIQELKPKVMLDDEKNIETIKNLSEEFFDFDHLRDCLKTKGNFTEKTPVQKIIEFLVKAVRKFQKRISEFIDAQLKIKGNYKND